MFELGYVLLKDEFPFGLNLSLLPDRVLSEDLVSSRESRIMEHVGVPFEHVTQRGTEFGQTSISFFLFFGLEPVRVLNELL